MSQGLPQINPGLSQYVMSNARMSKTWLSDQYMKMSSPRSSAYISGVTDSYGEMFKPLGQIHRLKVWCRNPDTGEDGWYGEYEWDLMHHPACEKRRWTMEEMYRARYEHKYKTNTRYNEPLRCNIIDHGFQYGREQEVWTWECEMAEVLNNIRSLSILHPTKFEDLEEGDYDVQLCRSPQAEYQQYVQYPGKQDHPVKQLHQYRISLL